jgi:RecG-like helicase
MKIRGYGDILGTNQSGDKFFKVTNLDEHAKYMSESMKYAKFLLNKINSKDAQTIRNTKFLLKIFNKYIEREYLKSG